MSIGWAVIIIAMLVGSLLVIYEPVIDRFFDWVTNIPFRGPSRTDDADRIHEATVRVVGGDRLVS